MILVVAALAVLASVSMVLTLTDANVAFRKARGSSLGAGSQEVLRALSAHINTLGNPDLQIVPYTTTGAADVVIANVACKLHAIYMKKPTASTTDAWLKGSDHATVASANGDIVTKLIGTGGGGREYCVTYADGLALGTGLTIASHTTVNGSTDSAAADSASGFCILSAAL
jgi:hypothetical protein